MKQLYLFITVVCTTILSSCRSETNQQEKIEYSVMTVTPSDVTLTESYSASIRGRQDIVIYPQVSGTITSVCVKEGQKVRRGELLFVIDQVPYQAALRTAKANVHVAKAHLETARLDYDSKQQLFQQDVISEYELSTSRNALAIAEASLEQAVAQETNARNSLSYTEIKSPVDGLVGIIPYRTGTLVSSASPEPLTTVSDNSDMYVYFSISEQQLQTMVRRYGSIHKMVAQMPPVQLQLSDGTLYPQKGCIESVSGLLNPQTGSGSLRAVFPNKECMLLSGSTGNVQIPYTLHRIITIPQDATYELQDKIFVYRVVDGKAIATRIEINPIHDGSNYTVMSGLSDGDVIVTTGVGLLNNGDVVTVK